MPRRTPAFTISRNTIRLTILLIIVCLPALRNLGNQPLPRGLGKKVRDARSESLQRRAEAFVYVIFSAGLVGPVDDERLPFDVGPREEAPVAAVLRIVAVVAHDEVVIGGHRLRSVVLADVVGGDLLAFAGGGRQEVDVWLRRARFPGPEPPFS